MNSLLTSLLLAILLFSCKKSPEKIQPLQEAITESVYRRMEAERKRVANELRSTGAAEGE